MSSFLHFDNPVHASIAIVFAILIAASCIVWFLRRTDSEGEYLELSARVKSWWFMIAIFSFAILTSPVVSVVFFGLISFLALKEYFSIIPLRRADRRAIFWVYITIPVQYYFVANGLYGLFIVFIPVWVFFLLPFRLILAGETDGFLESAGKISWGLMITVFAVSHAAMLMQYSQVLVGHVGLIMFLAILNQGNDVAQYTWGKLFGKRKILPKISPKKTWEGFLGGVITTAVGAVLLHSFLTPFSVSFAFFVGIVIAVTGFIGDVIISAIKRDLNIKDSGSLIPGHGGILDRIDSLSLTAPLFFHTVRYFYYVG